MPRKSATNAIPGTDYRDALSGRRHLGRYRPRVLTQRVSRSEQSGTPSRVDDWTLQAQADPAVHTGCATSRRGNRPQPTSRIQTTSSWKVRNSERRLGWPGVCAATRPSTTAAGCGLSPLPTGASTTWRRTSSSTGESAPFTAVRHRRLRFPESVVLGDVGVGMVEQWTRRGEPVLAEDPLA